MRQVVQAKITDGPSQRTWLAKRYRLREYRDRTDTTLVFGRMDHRQNARFERLRRRCPSFDDYGKTGVGGVDFGAKRAGICAALAGIGTIGRSFPINVPPAKRKNTMTGDSIGIGPLGLDEANQQIFVGSPRAATTELRFNGATVGAPFVHFSETPRQQLFGAGCDARKIVRPERRKWQTSHVVHVDDRVV
jgi:hypothetical protein